MTFTTADVLTLVIIALVLLNLATYLWFSRKLRARTFCLTFRETINDLSGLSLTLKNNMLDCVILEYSDGQKDKVVWNISTEDPKRQQEETETADIDRREHSRGERP